MTPLAQLIVSWIEGLIVFAVGVVVLVVTETVTEVGELDRQELPMIYIYHH